MKPLGQRKSKFQPRAVGHDSYTKLLVRKNSQWIKRVNHNNYVFVVSNLISLISSIVLYIDAHTMEVIVNNYYNNYVIIAVNILSNYLAVCLFVSIVSDLILLYVR